MFELESLLNDRITNEINLKFISTFDNTDIELKNCDLLILNYFEFLSKYSIFHYFFDGIDSTQEL